MNPIRDVRRKKDRDREGEREREKLKVRSANEFRALGRIAVELPPISGVCHALHENPFGVQAVPRAAAAAASPPLPRRAAGRRTSGNPRELPRLRTAA